MNGVVCSISCSIYGKVFISQWGEVACRNPEAKHSQDIFLHKPFTYLQYVERCVGKRWKHSFAMIVLPLHPTSYSFLLLTDDNKLDYCVPFELPKDLVLCLIVVLDTK